MTLAERRARLFAEMMGATKIEHWDSDNYEEESWDVDTPYADVSYGPDFPKGEWSHVDESIGFGVKYD